MINFKETASVTIILFSIIDIIGSIPVIIAFPLIAGAGTMTTIVSLRAEFQVINILLGIAINLALVYLVLKSCVWLENKIGRGGFIIIRKVMGIILIAIAIKLIKTNLILP